MVWRTPGGERELSCEKRTAGFRCVPDAALTAGAFFIDLAYQSGAGWVALERRTKEYWAWRLKPRRELYRWNDDGEYVLTADGTFALSADGRLRVVDLLAKPELRPVETDRKRVVQVLRAPAGPLLAVRSDGCSVRLVGLESGELRATIDACATAIALSRDGRFVVVGSDNQVGVWDLASGGWVARRSVPHKVVAVAMSWHQQYIATSTRFDLKDRITLWRWQWSDVRESVCRTLEQNLKTEQWTKLVDRRELAVACASARR
jgi:hypothetical protein